MYQKRIIVFLIVIFLSSISLMPKSVNAFGHRELAYINIGIPAIRAIITARKNKSSVGKALLQAICGGYIMQEGFKLAAGSEKKSAWQAWEAKLMVNMGASIAESAAKDFVFKMDIGPVWLIVDGKRIKFKPGVTSTLSTVMNFTDGSRLDWGKTFKYGTLAFNRNTKKSGALNSSGALAYSNTNVFTTNESGVHAGHELVHTFQYRRDAFMFPNLSELFPRVGERLGDKWFDDTGWSLNWGLQCAWADITGNSKDFDIPMEREAYYLEERYKQKY